RAGKSGRARRKQQHLTLGDLLVPLGRLGPWGDWDRCGSCGAVTSLNTLQCNALTGRNGTICPGSGWQGYCHLRKRQYDATSRTGAQVNTFMSQPASKLHAEAIVVVGHSDIVASDVDWRRESGERGVLDRRHLPTLRAGGVTVVCDHVGGDAPYGY